MKYLRDQLQYYGAETLSCEELLCLVLRSSPARPDVLERIHTLLHRSGSMQDLFKLDFGQLAHEHGLGKAKAAQIQAVLELARRLSIPSVNQKSQIIYAHHAADLVMPAM